MNFFIVWLNIYQDKRFGWKKYFPLSSLQDIFDLFLEATSEDKIIILS